MAFGRQVEVQDLALALASYVRTILSGNSPYDRYLSGERDALSVQAWKGLQIFRRKGNCRTLPLPKSATSVLPLGSRVAEYGFLSP